MKCLRNIVVLILLVIVAAGVWVYSGSYNIGADVPHWALTQKVLSVLRERSIEVHSDHVTTVPNLEDPALVKLGAQHYREMCTGCHLAPGMTSSEMREGLYPRPPNLTRFAPDPVEAFWVIKHGIKMSAMPAWGKTHDDHKIWAMVAYLQKQPHMSVARYQELSAGGDEGDEANAHGPAPGATVAAPASAVAPAAAVSTH